MEIKITSKPKDHNTSIKDFVTIIDKQIGKLKDTDPKGTSTKETTMPKEIAESIKPKTPKQHKGIHMQHDDKQKNVTPKRNASTRSPIKGNPGKKQKDTKKN